MKISHLMGKFAATALMLLSVNGVTAGGGHILSGDLRGDRYNESQEDLEDLPQADDLEVERVEAVPPKSSHGFYSPLVSVPNYNCSYASNGSATFTTLYADNQDGGSNYSKNYSGSYSGSSCDYYDNFTGKKYNGEYCGSHPGVDIAVNTGTAIYAIGSGSVYKVDTAGSTGWGRYIVLKLNVTGNNEQPRSAQLYTSGAPVPQTIYVTYAHLNSVDAKVKSGAAVSAAQYLGTTGNTGNSTGAHLHFQIDRSTTGTHPYWPSGAPNTPDQSRTKTDPYLYNPLSAIGFGTCF